jgi:hypothetical protein
LSTAKVSSLTKLENLKLNNKIVMEAILVESHIHALLDSLNSHPNHFKETTLQVIMDK